MLIGFTFNCYSQKSDYDYFQKKYEYYSNENKLDSALFFAKQMNFWAFKNEGDSSLRYAISYRYQGNCFSDMELIDSSIYYWNESVNILNKQNRSKSIDAANCFYNLGTTYYDLEEYSLAIKFYLLFTDIHKEIFGEDNEEYYSALSDLGAFYRIIGEYRKSENYLLKSLKIQKNNNCEDNLQYAYSLINLSNLYSDLDMLESSLQQLSKSLDIIYKNIGMNNEDYLITLNNIAGIYFDMGNYELAEKKYLDVLSGIKKLKGELNEDYARCLDNLGVIYSTNDKFFEAKRLLNKSSEIYKIVLGQNHYLYARSLMHSLHLIFESSDYQTQLTYCNEALEIYKKSLGEEHPEYSSCLVTLGQIHSSFGNYKNAEICFRKAMDIYKPSFGYYHGDVSHVKTLIGNLYADMGNYNDAKSEYLEVLDINAKIYGLNHPTYSVCLYNIGRIFFLMNDLNNAEIYFKKALRINKMIFGKNNSYYAASINSLGLVYDEKKDYYKAISLFKKSLGIYNKLYELNNDIAMVKNNLGISYEHYEDVKTAEIYYKEAYDIRSKLLPIEHPDFIFSVESLGDFYWGIKDYLLASEKYSYAMLLKSSYLRNNLSWLSTTEKVCFWKQEKEFYEKLNEFAVEINLPFKPSNVLSYNSNLLEKSFLLETSRELDQAISNSSDKLLKSQFNDMKQLRRLVNKMQSEGTNKKELIEHYIHQADSLDKILVNTLGEYANAKHKFEIKWKDVQANLSTSEAAIEFARYYDDQDTIYKYMALVVRPEFEYPKLVKLGSELKIKSSCSQREFSDLYNYVWSGIDSLLNGVKTIYYSPVGELNNVPFSALINDNNYQSDSLKSNWSYLMDRYDLQQLTTTRYLADGTLKDNESIPLSIKLIGGVNYSDLPLSKDSIEINETTEDYALQINLQSEVNDSKSNRGGKLDYLKGSEIEVKEIAKTLKNSGWETTISDGKNAGEYQFKSELNVKGPGIIHISTHGFAFPEKEIKEEKNFHVQEKSNYKISEDPMVRCGLMFSGANISWSGDSKKMIETTGDDGILTAAEVANLDLSNTKLVVLSACETGLGKIESSEGTFGLKRGFKLAGVDQIIVSLWKVPDNETMELMTLFYSELALSKDIVSSFNKAQKEMRNRFPYEPEKWAGFVLVR
jgi:CHAT domain-containing protein